MSDRAERAIARALLDHFDAHRRTLPWRETDDPYAIWVSEVMLQQTRVETVIPYYRRWLDRFPTIDDLARAEPDSVLREWQGLGYYSRARNLHRAARVVRERYGGRVPEEAEKLRSLPGVGEYTAGAVASIAFGEPVPAVDGNVRRVLARVYDLENPTPGALRRLATGLVPRDRPGDHNQALMELGATICTHRSPACDRCPLTTWCRAWRLGVQEERPAPRPQKPLPEETVATRVVVRCDGALLLVRRPEGGLLGGMWEFPGLERAGRSGAATVAGVLERSEPVAELEPITHTFSHKRIRSGFGGPAAGVAWVLPCDLGAYALPVAQQRIAQRALARLEARAPGR
jgi:A/G-specific adenine glycosylase